MIGRTNATGKTISGIFPITTTVVNGTFSGATITASGNTAIVVISANQDYQLPTIITVSGASYTYDSGTGTIILTNPTGSISINANCLLPAIYVDVYCSTLLYSLEEAVEIYDGQNDSGTLLGTLEPGDMNEYAIRSGYIYVKSAYGEDPAFVSEDYEKLSNPYPVTEPTTLYIESEIFIG